jgi:hypothetical protein
MISLYKVLVSNYTYVSFVHTLPLDGMTLNSTICNNIYTSIAMMAMYMYNQTFRGIWQLSELSKHCMQSPGLEDFVSDHARYEQMLELYTLRPVLSKMKTRDKYGRD